MRICEVAELAVASLCFIVTILLLPDLSQVADFVKSVWKGITRNGK